MKNRVASKTVLFAALSGALLISCGQKHPRNIPDAAALRQDCSMLYQQFPVDKTPTDAPDFDYQHSLGIRKIPKNRWTAPITALNPYMVCSYEAGLQIWMSLGTHDGDEVAYYVATNSSSPPPGYNTRNHFIFEKTAWEGVYLVTQKF